jgi:hypothetical protein
VKDLNCRTKEQGEAQAMMHRTGYARGGALRQEEGRPALKDKRMVKKAVRQHETHDHKGEPKTDLKLKSGGDVEGDRAFPRLDQRARGGGMMPGASMKGSGPPKKAGGHGGAKVNVNIISPGASHAEKQQAAMAGMQMGAKLGAAGGARPPMGGPPPGAGIGGAPRPPMPPPGPGGAPMGPMKRGGAVCR